MAGEVGCSLEEIRVQPSLLGKPKTRRQTAWSGGKRIEAGDATLTVTAEPRHGSRPTKYSHSCSSSHVTGVSKVDIISVIQRTTKLDNITYTVLHAK
jgi:hypothetical protein